MAGTINIDYAWLLAFGHAGTVPRRRRIRDAWRAGIYDRSIRGNFADELMFMPRLECSRGERPKGFRDSQSRLSLVNGPDDALFSLAVGCEAPGKDPFFFMVIGFCLYMFLILDLN